MIADMITAAWVVLKLILLRCQLDRKRMYELYLCKVDTWVKIKYRCNIELSMKINILWMQIETSLRVENTQYCAESYQSYDPHHQHRNWSCLKIVLL